MLIGALVAINGPRCVVAEETIIQIFCIQRCNRCRFGHLPVYEQDTLIKPIMPRIQIALVLGFMISKQFSFPRCFTLTKASKDVVMHRNGLGVTV